ncbi:related to polymerase I core factor (CF) subunit [Rhynchosporium agropyri]|uniref:Related to polymerase I core factor (CF) subunit n=1 Tax=Rhynchosporium agropyri TaxID=914238 RepID=A0A1E1K6R0_9HELO|nr:related to polymerase I core factor (CF) subunit [Rhynchosporium agropyri]
MSSHIEYQRFPREESCAEEGCRARKFYIEDGKKFCLRGHEQAGFTQTQQDEDDWNAQGKKSRKKKEEKERIETTLSGGAARDLYLQCYQLILWKQAHYLVTNLGLPKEVQITVRDLWGIRLELLPPSKDVKSPSGSGTGTMLFSSTGEGDNTDTDGTTQRSTGSRRSRKSAVAEDKLPKLVETLATCYLVTLLLKIPVTVEDFRKWAIEDRIIYNRAIQEIPKEMRSKLPAHFHAALEIRAPLQGAKLHRGIASLAAFYNKEYNMEFKVNIPLLTYRFMKDLCLPVEVHPTTCRLQALINIDISYHAHLTGTSGATPYPEVQLMSLVVIATKLLHPFDDIKRAPGSYSDPSAVKVDWSRWVELTAPERMTGLARGEAINVKETDVWEMNPEKIDNYLDWYQRMWIDDKKSKLSEELLQHFPLDDVPPPAAEHDPRMDQDLKRLKDIQGSLILQKPISIEEAKGSDIVRSGELYERYRTVESLPQEALAFFSMAASKVGISLDTLVRTVFQLETQFEKCRLANLKGSG